MIDHTGIIVADIARSGAFYQQALAPIGYTLLADFPAAVTGSVAVAGFGEAPKPDFWLAAASTARPVNQPRLHVAFRAATRAMVDAFYHAALAAGAADNGAPGLRPHYHPHYYGAFVLDPDGHNIEAVCHEPA
ncbi:MAG: VOC family protein [Pseudomonadota bacterium]|nr:VOC family protein [Pseudomonadota bacterium]